MRMHHQPFSSVETFYRFSVKSQRTVKAAAKVVSRHGTDKITMREIDREITAYRKEKRL